jgi:hypothetical protein
VGITHGSTLEATPVNDGLFSSSAAGSTDWA